MDIEVICMKDEGCGMKCQGGHNIRKSHIKSVVD